MAAIQAIHVRGWEDRPEPKPHTVYRIEIQASVRSWQMWRRYSEFADLHVELTKSCGAPPPAPLPPKHPFSFLRGSKTSPALLEERRAALEQYLRAILAAKDDVWRESFAFRDFLGVPVGKQDVLGGGSSAGGTGFTASSWLDEHQDVQARVRDVRADINRRDALGDANDVAGSRQANLQAKKKLAGVLTRVSALEDGLRALGLGGMSEGELQRRTDMVARLRDDCEKLAKIVTAARTTSRGMGSAAERNPALETDREALLGPSGGGSGMPGGFNRPVARVFGQKAQPVETEETHPLDDQGLLQLHQTKIDQQDAQLAQLSTILQRQKGIGLAIHQEINEQNEMLDGLTSDVDHVGAKLTKAKREMNKLG
ncbi:Phox-like protein [Dichomitus squalens LYAD-421 SS1]|uniref:Phox-like protein n=1 Tax=Dichomitus squalens (strain LYAD-421) TaxID=732165 RepID=UPI00044159EF|nr:Phox-like protein [Dichomitus squalens LYAD-421 SS1]EJF66643.1 Phox-like protein [Dichomitus squalens LYAD-421 SS1]